MSILNIETVKRKHTKFFIALAGQSGGGKTYSALQLAYGLANKDASKIGFIDTENGRGSMYADVFSEPYLIGTLMPPFSPQRYIQAIKEFCDLGIEVLIIDSYSHIIEGEGGCEDIAYRPKANGEQRKTADWITAKREHRKFMNVLLHSPCHVIACVRAREKHDFTNPSNPVSMGIQPICEKNFMFEVTLSYMISESGKKRMAMKTSEFLDPIVGTNGYLTAEHGIGLRNWLGGSDPVENAKNILRLAASSGNESLKSAWVSLDKSMQKILITFKDSLKDLANHSDKEQQTTTNDDSKPDIEW